jgi:hypothetical protein
VLVQEVNRADCEGRRHLDPAPVSRHDPLIRTPKLHGTIIAASMSLLSASRHGMNGEVLPWTLLTVSALASLDTKRRGGRAHPDRPADRRLAELRP